MNTGDSFVKSPFSSKILLPRSLISLAAFLVKVITRMSRGDASFSAIIKAVLATIVFVFPLPAPASISTGPLRVVAASFCSALSSSIKV